MKHYITLEDLDNNHGKVIAQGNVEDSPEGIHINGTGKTIKYIVKVGAIGDWCIYAEDCYRYMSFEEVIREGNKIMESTAHNLVEASEEVWDRWRS